MAVVIETTLGDMTVDLYVEKRPITCKNFLKLCKIKYYNLCLFHSIQRNFIAQTGDPTDTGKNGESIYGKIDGDHPPFFEAEMVPELKHTKPGLVSMFNCGNNMLGSQFFITLGSDLQSLDSEHCVFGEVAEGMDVLRKLNKVKCDSNHRSCGDVRITHTVILEDPFDDPEGLQVPDRSPEPTRKMIMNVYIAPDKELDEATGTSAAEIQEQEKTREENVGDLPDSEMAPQGNTLFISNLNPVTNDEDLEVIFSRFGKIKSCKIIRNKTTGASLQYAFIEYEDRKACEDAYFKMDNVLIDDRRIRVDFSKSWKGKGRSVEHKPKGQMHERPAGHNSYSNNNSWTELENSKESDRQNTWRREIESQNRDRRNDDREGRHRHSRRKGDRDGRSRYRSRHESEDRRRDRDSRSRNESEEARKYKDVIVKNLGEIQTERKTKTRS
ncbi:hypothetical protein L9F63_024361 [Diploptera punctata]|uniref:Peptidyl-prolyl cis-trans isomerase n=1 Tax=Diploptera punctata TaxID=6984 RepID=A0AAD7ZGY0_DIPPU|nr:hypothetical protein L9F63_024361 [Diploptera punctata]